MENKKCRVQVQKDHLDKVSRAKPPQAVAELIWNALDGDANVVNVYFHHDSLGLERVEVQDDGEGIPYDKADSFFSALGGSWKAEQELSGVGRYLHGQEGQGRFKAFAIGRVVEWVTVYESGGRFYRYSIIGKEENKDEFEITPVSEVESRKAGTTVTVSELKKRFRSLDKDNATAKLSPIFANYLSKYPSVSILVEGEKLDPDSFVEYRQEFELAPVRYNGELFSYQLEVIEWQLPVEKEFFFCNEAGFPLERYDKPIRGSGDCCYTAYLKSKHISVLNTEGTLGLMNLEPSLVDVVAEATGRLKQFFVDRKLRRSQHLIDRWKDQAVYPYKKPPATPVETAERQIFDILAIDIAEQLPDFDQLEIKLKRLQLKLLQQIVERNAGDLQTILAEVLNLSGEKQRELADLLQGSSLSAIIGAANVVTERLKFIAGLEEVLFDRTLNVNFKERSQLHRILADNTWFFGDEYSLTVDDGALTRVLRAHLSQGGTDKIVVDGPVKRIDGKTGIIDLMLSRAVPCNHANEREHLVIELKAPTVTVGSEEITQIKKYAYTVIKDPRFANLKTRWEFIVVSNKLNEYAEMDRQEGSNVDGVIQDRTTENGARVVIKVKTWSEILSEAKHRLEFVRQQLNLNVDSTEGLKHLKEKYAEYTKGVIVDPDLEKTG